MALGIAMDHLFVAHSRESFRVPVHHAHTPVYQTFLIEVHKGSNNRFRQFGIHGKLCAVPIARCTEFPELLQNDSTVLFLPFPCIFQELFTGDIFLGNTHAFQLGDNLAFGCDGCMVGAGHPAGVFAVHAGLSDQHVVKGIVEHMPHVKDAGNIGRRDYDSIRFTGIRLRMEAAVFLPISIPLVLHFGRIVFRVQFHNLQI